MCFGFFSCISVSTVLMRPKSILPRIMTENNFKSSVPPNYFQRSLSQRDRLGKVSRIKIRLYLPIYSNLFFPHFENSCRFDPKHSIQAFLCFVLFFNLIKLNSIFTRICRAISMEFLGLNLAVHFSWGRIVYSFLP